MRVKDIISVMSPIEMVEIDSINNDEEAIFRGKVKNIPSNITECDIIVNNETFNFCHICCDAFVMFIDEKTIKNT